MLHNDVLARVAEVAPLAFPESSFRLIDFVLTRYLLSGGFAFQQRFSLADGSLERRQRSAGVERTFLLGYKQFVGWFSACAALLQAVIFVRLVLHLIKKGTR